MEDNNSLEEISPLQLDNKQIVRPALERHFIRILAIRSQGISLTTLNQKHFLPPTDPQNPKTILLDLDHTLIFPFQDKSFFRFQVPVLFTKKYNFPFLLRLGAIQFIEKLGEVCEIVLYSSGTRKYIIDIINRVPIFNSYIKYILSRDDCCKCREGYLKSAKILNRAPEDVIVVDDSFSVYPEDLDNVVPVVPFENVDMYETDNELSTLSEYILELIKVKDVRESLSTKFRLRNKLLQFSRSVGPD